MDVTVLFWKSSSSHIPVIAAQKLESNIKCSPSPPFSVLILHEWGKIYDRFLSFLMMQSAYNLRPLFETNRVEDARED